MNKYLLFLLTSLASAQDRAFEIIIKSSDGEVCFDSTVDTYKKFFNHYMLQSPSFKELVDTVLGGVIMYAPQLTKQDIQDYKRVIIDTNEHIDRTNIEDLIRTNFISKKIASHDVSLLIEKKLREYFDMFDRIARNEPELLAALGMSKDKAYKLFSLLPSDFIERYPRAFSEYCKSADCRRLKAPLHSPYCPAGLAPH